MSTTASAAAAPAGALATPGLLVGLEAARLSDGLRKGWIPFQASERERIAQFLDAVGTELSSSPLLGDVRTRTLLEIADKLDYQSLHTSAIAARHMVNEVPEELPLLRVSVERVGEGENGYAICVDHAHRPLRTAPWNPEGRKEVQRNLSLEDANDGALFWSRFLGVQHENKLDIEVIRTQAQEDHEALQVMRWLDTGEWALTRALADDDMTDAWNEANRWFVRRTVAPYAEQSGSRQWSGNTAYAAIVAAMTALAKPTDAKES